MSVRLKALMKRLALAVAVPFLAASMAWAQEAIITFIRGEVEVFRPGRVNWEKARPGTMLKAGDKIRTGKKSQANTTSKEGHRLTIKERTVLEITQLGSKAWDLRMQAGKSRFSVAKLGPGQSFRVRTPTAVCAVRGTEFQVELLEDESTVLDVFSGIVAFGDIQGTVPEVPIMENQRTEVHQGEAAPKSPEAIPEREVREAREERTQMEELEHQFMENREKLEEHRKGEEDKDRKEEGKLERRDDFRREIEKEQIYDAYREGIEAEAAFQQQASTYEESKTLIDAFGQMVRLEEYVTRPAPESFKYVALNHRENRLDHMSFEVAANKALPDDLTQAGNLWFSLGGQKPDFYAVKQRMFATNTKDTVEQIDLDGDSKPVQFQEPQFGDAGEFLGVTNQAGFQTVFDHRYEFINGNPLASARLWSDTGFRPLDNGVLSNITVTGMMWHMRPILIERFDPGNSFVSASFWGDAFVTTTVDGLFSNGRFDWVSFEPNADNPFLAHFIEKHNYINFTDTNANGRLDQGERYADLNANGTHDINEPFEDVVQLGLNGAKDTSRLYDGARDQFFFSDLNRNGLRDDGNDTASPFSASQDPWAWVKNESFMVNDLGHILDLRAIGQGAIGAGAGDSNAIAQAFEQVNFERVWTSSEFGGRKIDIVVTPRLLLKSGLLETRVKGNEDLDRR